MIYLYGQAPARGDQPGSLPFQSGPHAELLARLAGLTVRDWTLRVETANVLPSWPGRSATGKGDRFPIADARARANVLRKSWQPGDFVLLAGHKVAEAFEIGAPYFQWRRVDGVAISVIPHPSRVNRFWNRPEAEQLVAQHLRATLLEAS